MTINYDRPGEPGHVTPFELEILRLRQEGVTPMDISRRLGVSRSTVYRCFKRHAIRHPINKRERDRLVDTRRLLTDMLRYVNGTIDKDRVLATMAEFETKWVHNDTRATMPAKKEDGR